ncbi:MAG TPA: DUF1800 family protein [Bryobacteraceae bacterium]|nr:DUF1800 family protein [Bryobacteraceae bacterium]
MRSVLKCSYLVLLFAAPVVPGFGQSSAQQLSAAAAARFLDQATWGPTPASIAQLQQTGITNWLKAQFALNTSNLPDQPILTSAGLPNYDLSPVKAAFFQNTVSGQDQLRQRVAFALSQIWVVSAGGGVPKAYAYPPYWRLFRDKAFGNYRDVIQALTLSPAMGRYLNMANNNKANPAKNTSANENYARELMQLFTLGLTELNPDGSPVVDQNKNPAPTFDLAVVTNMAKLLTGWTYPTAPGATAHVNNPEYFIGQMFAVESEHDTTAKSIFGNVTIPAGQTAEQDLNSLLDALMAQPTMAPFVSQQLIQHLVTSNPSPQYIERVSKIFEDDGHGVTGNLQAVITAILTDPEARAGDDPTAAVNPAFGHLREPVLFLPNILRGLNATLSANSTIYYDTSLLSENLFDAPSVFSYFSPQYRVSGGLLGPEFQIQTTQTAANRADIVYSILYGQIDKGTTVNLTPFVQQAGSAASLLSYISSIFLHGSMSSALTQAATGAIDAQTTALAKTQAALYVVLTSGEYQIIH